MWSHIIFLRRSLPDSVHLVGCTHITHQTMFNVWLDALFTAFPSKIRIINFLTGFAVVFVVVLESFRN